MNKLSPSFPRKDAAPHTIRRAAVVRAVSLAMLGLLMWQGSGLAQTVSDIAGPCPSGTFKPLFRAGCAKPSAESKLPLDEDEPMRFETIQLSKSVLYLQAIGRVTKATPSDFARFMTSDTAKLSRDLVIHSRSGDLLDGLELGRAIRAAQLNTSIGRSVPLEGTMRVYRYGESICASACAYAFLGGVSRSYSAGAVYVLDRSAFSQDISRYVEEMGVDQRMLKAAAADNFIVPEALGKEWRVIFDASGLTRFSVGENRGRTVATFSFTHRDHKFGGMLYCEQGHPVMAILDRDDSIHRVLRIMNKFPVEFEANGRKIPGNVTYVGSTDTSPATVLFLLPSLDGSAFSGSGLTLASVTNPQLPSPALSPSGAGGGRRGLLEALSWGDAESSFLFRIAAADSERVLAPIFRDCR